MPEVSIIVPCYQEETHLENSVSELVFSLQAFKFDYELIFIDDNSVDKTQLSLQSIQKKYDRVRVLYNHHNIGRGATVERGIKESTAKVVGFIDIDLCTPPVNIATLIQLVLEDVVDVATANRIYKLQMATLPFMIHRVILSYGYRILSRYFLWHKFADTETGAKFFDRKKILPVVDKIEDKHWFWDTEVMLLSAMEGLRVVEMPTVYVRRLNKPTTVKIVKNVFLYLKNLWVFRARINEFRKKGGEVKAPYNYEQIWRKLSGGL
jgi:glycosyltransferase involved in cell wall biosynthesis